MENKMNRTTKLPKNNRELKAVTNPMAVIALNSLIGGTVRINRAIAIIKDFISSFGKAFLSMPPTDSTRVAVLSATYF